MHRLCCVSWSHALVPMYLHRPTKVDLIDHIKHLYSQWFHTTYMLEKSPHEIYIKSFHHQWFLMWCIYGFNYYKIKLDFGGLIKAIPNPRWYFLTNLMFYRPVKVAQLLCSCLQQLCYVQRTVFYHCPSHPLALTFLQSPLL